MLAYDKCQQTSKTQPCSSVEKTCPHSIFSAYPGQAWAPEFLDLIQISYVCSQINLSLLQPSDV